MSITCPTRTSPDPTSAASVSERTMQKEASAMRSRRLSMRSAKAPATGDRKSGTWERAATVPRSSREPVSE